MPRLALILLAALFAGYCYWGGRAIPQPPGILEPNDPVQENVEDGPHWDIDGYDVHALARFEVDARVLSAEHYRWDREAELSPVDLALGWGPMSSNEVIDTLDVSQHGRFFFYSWPSGGPKIPLGEIVRHAANMHMVPLDAPTRATLLDVRRGNLVHLKGWLIEAHAKDGWHWRSSLSRGDSGGGACEVVLVESAAVE
jgi:hypothetical protein